MIKQHLTWTQIEDLAIRLADRLPTSYDVMLVITRGGMVPACIISERLIINAFEGAGRITASSTVVDEHGDTHRW